MRRYDDPVQVRRGMVQGQEAPAQFVWRERLWQVRAVVAHWVETGPWWQSSGVRAVVGDDEAASARVEGRLERPAGDLLQEHECWRVEAGRGPDRVGVFDLVLDWTSGDWQLAGCVD